MLIGTIDCVDLAFILNKRMSERSGGSNQRLAIMLGMLTKDQQIKANIPSKDKSAYSLEKYKFFLDAPFEISNRCCNVMKKDPAHRYEKETGRKAITGQMADESRLRTQKWLQYGCNSFDAKKPVSNPLSFWQEQDILQYIKQFDLPICCIYGNIVTDDEATGQMNLADFDSSYATQKLLKTTGCQRTGCTMCCFGASYEKKGEGRFEKLKQTHPGMYNLLDHLKNNGITYREAIEWTNEHLKRGHIEL